MQGVNMGTVIAPVEKNSRSTPKDSASDKGDFTSTLAAVVDHQDQNPSKKVEQQKDQQQDDQQKDDQKETNSDQSNNDSLVTMYVPLIVNAAPVETKGWAQTTADILQKLQQMLPNLTAQDQKSMKDLLTGLQNLLSQGQSNGKNIQDLFSQVQGVGGQELTDFLAQLKNSLLEPSTADANQMNQLITKMQEMVENKKDPVASQLVMESDVVVEKAKNELTGNHTDSISEKVSSDSNKTQNKTAVKGMGQPVSAQVLAEKGNTNSTVVKENLTVGEKVINASLSGKGSEKEPVAQTIPAGSNSSVGNTQMIGPNGNNLPTSSVNGVTAEPITVAELGSKLQGMLQELMVNKQPNQTTMQFKLQPANLGDVVVKLVLNQGELTAHFYAANHQAKEALEAALPQMRDSLQQQIKVGDTSVFLQQDSHWSGGQNQRQPSPQLPYGKVYGKNDSVPPLEEVNGEIIQGTEIESQGLGINHLI